VSQPIFEGGALRSELRFARANWQETVLAYQQTVQNALEQLNVFPLHVPPLRERPEDISPLVQHFVQGFSQRVDRNIESVSKQAMDVMVTYTWPGNVRELENVIERAVIMSSGSELRVPVAELSRVALDGDNWKPQTLEEAERAHILATLKKTRWVLPGGMGRRFGWD